MEKPKPKLVSISSTEKEKVQSFETTSEIFSASSHQSSMVSTVLYHHRPHRLLLDPGQNANESRSHNGPFSNEANFDTNMVIILAALLCALICALGLNSIVRCALRCSRRLSFETLDETAARLAGTGLKRSTLRQIPIVAYGTGVLNIPNATDCPICLGEFSDGQKVRVLPNCNHGFHVRCIDTWLFSHSSCPTCRQSLLLEAQPQGSDSPSGQNDVVVAVAGDEAG
ncbi:PREDICTED: RING-H2 finger protein ATL72-like [Fragaria vesca subsp. vesca]|uniref:RING-H2 finger protein ATL74-like n=1 Tax=Fragaria vesca subsp. vesca TaxID=101020 RepID=UPI0002C3493E|nr:PREDICTED: RING-H2 finger protein ATL74-like [Fragaria vesca subsp. vesca]